MALVMLLINQKNTMSCGVTPHFIMSDAMCDHSAISNCIKGCQEHLVENIWLVNQREHIFHQHQTRSKVSCHGSHVSQLTAAAVCATLLFSCTTKRCA